MQETLDPALTRPGRFDRRVAVPMPDVRGRLEILEHYLKVRSCFFPLSHLSSVQTRFYCLQAFLSFNLHCETDGFLKILTTLNLKELLSPRYTLYYHEMNTTQQGSEQLP